ncbi:MAG: histidinol dehydrogenase [Candidatus Dormibacteria bacterium]
MKVPILTRQQWAGMGHARRRFEVPELPAATLDRLSETLGLERQGLDATRAVEAIVTRVREGGDDALRALTASFDGVDVPVAEVTPAARSAASARVEPEVRAAIDAAARRIEDFHRPQVPRTVGSGELRLVPQPLLRAGIYVPGGRAKYPSTVLMNAIPARLAGVEEIVMVTPPAADGTVADAVLYAAEVAGVGRVFPIGGAQAIAALAYGTAAVPAVDKITGPGNLFVTLAKRAVFGVVDIDGLAGPTEIMVVADSSADAEQVWVDMASQLEHDPMAWSVLVTDSAALAEHVARALESDVLADRFKQGEGAPPHAICVLTRDIAEAIEVASAYAPEHLQLLVSDVDEYLPLVRCAGMTFTGPWSPVPMGDYIAGSNHTLPTGGAARYASPLGVYDFYRWTSVVNLAAETARALAPLAITLARVEGLPAHERSLRRLLSRIEEE